MRLAVTGASGFVGRSVVALATAERVEVLGLARSDQAARVVQKAGGVPVVIRDLDDTALARAFEGAGAVVHLAQIGSEHGDATYARVNVEGTRRVVVAARSAGVRRIVALSGLGVGHYGIWARCSNPYFLSKLLAEAALLESPLEAAIFRPSYIVGPGDGYVPRMMREMAEGEVEQVGDGSYRMQPIAVSDAAACILAAATGAGARHRVFDLVGPAPIAFRALLQRVACLARALGRAGEFRVKELPVAEADHAARGGGYRGMLADELDCLLCDEVGDSRPLESLLGRVLTPLDDALAATIL